MAVFDMLDRKILFELDHNSRQPLERIAKRLRQGRDKVIYRVERLVHCGIIRHFSVVLDPYKLGYALYKTYLKLENKQARNQELLSYLLKNRKVYWIAQCDGSWDLIFCAFAKHPYEFYEIQDAVLSRFHDLVLDYSVYTIIELDVFRKNYLVRKGDSFLSIGGKPTETELDDLEMRVLKMLSENSRVAVTDIARHLEITPVMARNRIEKLEKTGVISGYRVELDLQKLDLLFFKAQMYLKNYGGHLERDFFDYCRKHPFITYYIRQIGNCKLELELEVADYPQYNSIINDIREKFPDFIRNIETVLMHDTHFNWLPE